MPKFSVSWNGLDSFMNELRTLTADLVDEANAILTASAQAAQRDIAAAYPSKSGALRRGLTLKPSRGTVLAGLELVQLAPHANIYEGGTVERQTHTLANRGRMPANPTFRPIAAAYRRTAISDIEFRLYQHGASRVTNDAPQE
jgi:hypothetical protein